MPGKIENDVEKLIKGAVEALGYELVDVTYAKEGPNWVLTVFIDREGGIRMEDCEKVNAAIDPLLDEADPIEGHYYLSVSSPGLDRPLKGDADYRRNLGKEVLVTLYAPLDGAKKFSGTLLAFDEENVRIQCKDGERILPRRNIAMAKPDIQFR